MKTTLRRSSAASRNGPSEKRAGWPRKGNSRVCERSAWPGSVRSASSPAMPPSSSQRRSDNMAPARPSAMVWSCACGAMAASVRVMRRALSSNISIAIFMPRSWPMARKASKLPRCAPTSITPSPGAMAASSMSSPVLRRSNSRSRSCRK